MLRAVDRNLFEIIAWPRCYRVLNIYRLSRLECDALHIRPFLVLAGYSGESQTLECPLVADIVAKVSNRGATIFSPEDKTGRDRRLIWPQAYYRSRR